MTVPTELRPLSLGELLDRTFSLYRHHFWLFVGIAAIPQLVLLGPILLVDLLSSVAANSPLLAGLAMMALGLLLFVAWLIALGLTQAASVFALSEVYLGRPISIRETYSRVYGDIGRVIFVIILVFVGFLLGLALLVLPAIWFGLRASLSVMPAVLEDKPAVEAIRRGMELTKGSLGRVFVILLLFSVIGVVATVIFQWLPTVLVAAVAAGQPGPPPSWILVPYRVGKVVADVLAGPLLTIALSLLYFDLRMRKEGFDLKLMMDQLGRGATLAPGTPRLDGLGS